MNKKQHKYRFLKFLRYSWRPLMAYTLILSLFLYLIVGFFLKIYKIEVPVLPDGAWGLISVFAGAYAVSRGAEKVSSNWTGNDVDKDEDNTPDDSEPEGDKPDAD